MCCCECVDGNVLEPCRVNVEQGSNKVHHNTSFVASYTKRLNALQELVESSGVGGRKDIMPIKNFSEGMTSTAEVRVLVCRALQQALFAAVDQLRERKNVSWDEMMVARWAITHVKLMFTYLWHWVLSWR